MKKINITSQEDFNKTFEKTNENLIMSWNLLKTIMSAYPEYYYEYARTH